MGIFSGIYENSGAGVAKNGPDKKRFIIFFEVFFRKFWNLVLLNLIYFVFCIPIVTIGPATAGFTKVLKNYSQEKNAFLWSDFITSFKKNFKQAFPIGLFNIFMAFCIYLGFQMYPSLAKDNILFYVPFLLTCCITLTLIIMNFYIYLMIVSTDIKLKDILKNSFILTCVGIKKNFITLLVVGIIIAVNILLMLESFAFILLFPVLTLSIIGLVISFNSYPLIEKYVINPYYKSRGEENPDYLYLKPIDDDEVVFVDKGGSETPINKGAKGIGKIIS